MNDDYRGMYDKKYLGVWDLNGDVVVQIASVKKVAVKSPDGTVKSRPQLQFEGTDKGLLLNVGMGAVVANLFSPSVKKWVGGRITLYASTTEVGGKTVDCIRIRPQRPDEDVPTGTLKGRDPDPAIRAKQNEAWGEVERQEEVTHG